MKNFVHLRLPAALLFEACSPDTHQKKHQGDLALISHSDTLSPGQVDTNYIPTGFYYLAEGQKGGRMRMEKSNEIYTVNPTPFGSVSNIVKTSFETTGAYTELCMTFDATGTEDLKAGTGNPLQAKLAVVIAIKLMYVVENTTKIKRGVMCILLDGYTKQQMEAMRNAIDHKR